MSISPCPSGRASNSARMSRAAPAKTLPSGWWVSHASSCASAAPSASMPRARARSTIRFAFGVGDPLFGPGHLDDRHERQQGHRLGGEAELFQFGEDRGVANARCFAETAPCLFASCLLAELFYKLSVLFLKILILERAFTLGGRRPCLASVGARYPCRVLLKRSTVRCQASFAASGRKRGVVSLWKPCIVSG